MDNLTHMKRTPAEAKAVESPSNYKPNPYPYGLSIDLNIEQMKKLGITELPEIGNEYSITATGKVTSASKSASESGGESARMSIQITHLKLETDDKAEEAKESPAVEKAEKAPFDKARASNLAKMMR